jgi:flagellar protein FlaG
MPIDNISQLAGAQARTPVVRKPGQVPGAEGNAPRQPLPAGGEALPPESVTPPAQVAQAASQVGHYVQNLRRDLQFRVDDRTDKVVVSVVDPDSGEVIRQIPSEEMLEVARALGQVQGLLVNTKA